MRILITGHLGYIGTVLTPMLRARGHAVAGLDADLFRECTFGPEEAIVRIPAMVKDIRDVEPQDVRGFDAIIHLAGLSNDPLGDFDPALTRDINYLATVRLAEIARSAGVGRFLFASSCSNYGAAGEDLVDEDAPLAPTTAYAESKVAAERDVSPLATDAFSPVFLRNATAFGPSPRLRFDLVVNNLVAWAVATGCIRLKSDGSPWRPLVHVADIARAFAAMVEAPRELVHAAVINVGRTDGNHRIRDVARIVATAVPGCENSFAPGAGPDRRTYRVDCSRLARLFPEAVPIHDVEEGARQLAAVYRRHGLAVEDFEGPTWQRLAHLRTLVERGVIGGDLRRRPEPAVTVRATGGATGGAEAAAEAGAAIETRAAAASCRSCGQPGLVPVLDLGLMPLADRLVRPEDAARPEPRYPLEQALCETCGLAQILETVPPEVLFDADYPYFSSFSDALLAHSRENALELIRTRRLGSSSLVVELACNDGYMLRNFVEAGVPALGIDPAPGPVRVARALGIEVIDEFFSPALARQLGEAGRAADVVIANNVLAHVADLNGFVQGIRTMLKDSGVAVIEVPYVRDLIERTEFDTIYHEHLCYFSVTALETLFRRHDLHLNDVRRLPIHGGSLRLYVEPVQRTAPSVHALREEERRLGMDTRRFYEPFGRRVAELVTRIRELVGDLRQGGASLAGYGAAAKGAIMLNATGIDHRDLAFVVDRNVHKHDLLMPGVHVPIRPVETLLEEQPGATLLLAWNFRDEIVRQQAEYLRRGGRFVVPLPDPSIVHHRGAA